MVGNEGVAPLVEVEMNDDVNEVGSSFKFQRSCFGVDGGPNDNMEEELKSLVQ